MVAWKQVAVPNYGHSGVLLMPVKRMPHPDQVDPTAMAWQGATWPPAAAASARQAGTTEVVLRGVSREGCGRNREVILFTNEATGKQTVRMRFQTGGEELAAKNEGLTLFAARQGAAVAKSRSGQGGSGSQGVKEGGQGRVRTNRS